MTSEIASSSTGLKPYVEKELRHIAESAGFTDYTLASEAASKHGDGFSSTLERVSIVGKQKDSGDEKRLLLICKLLSDSVSRRKLFSLQKSHEREVYMYNYVLPELVSFQKSKSVSATDGFYQFPHSYYAISDDSSNEHMVVLDDQRTLGYEMWNKFEDIPYAKVRLVLGTLGRLHGVSFALKDQKPDVFSKHQRHLPDMMLHMLENSPGFEEMIDTNIQQAVQLYTEGSKERNYLENLQKTWVTSWYACLKPGASAFEVVIHGDCWTNNMMFRENTITSTSEVCFFDWQLSRSVTPIIDLTHYIFQSTNKSFRDKHLNELLRHYHDSLSNAVKKCGSSTDLFTYDDLIAEIQRFTTVSVTVAIIMLKIIVSAPEQIIPLEEYASNSTDAETGTTKDFISLNDHTEEVYKQRLTDLLNDAAENEWIKWE